MACFSSDTNRSNIERERDIYIYIQELEGKYMLSLFFGVLDSSMCYIEKSWLTQIRDAEWTAITRRTC